MAVRSGSGEDGAPEVALLADKGHELRPPRFWHVGAALFDSPADKPQAAVRNVYDNQSTRNGTTFRGGGGSDEAAASLFTDGRRASSKHRDSENGGGNHLPGGRPTLRPPLVGCASQKY